MKAHGNDALKAAKGIGSAIESTVESKAQPVVSGGIGKAHASAGVDCSVGQQCTYYHAISPTPSSHFHIGKHYLHLIGSIYKVAFARTNQHIYIQI